MSDRLLKYVFGPVPSRRLGRSLGVDLVPMKTCTLDCVYCQLGRTSEKTIERKEFVPFDDVVADLSHALSGRDRPDYITLAGSGEPTLYSRLGELIDHIHQLTDIPVDVLTNGTLLFDGRVRDEVGKSDLIIPSLDAGDPQTFVRINRPADGITFDKVVAGLSEFCKRFGPKVWLEVFIVKDINDSDTQVLKIAEITKALAVSRVQLNTAVRPAAEPTVRPLGPERLGELANLFDPPAQIIADYPQQQVRGEFKVKMQAVADLLRRRPCTLGDISTGLNVQPAETAKIIEKLIRARKIRSQRRRGQLYYLAE